MLNPESAERYIEQIGCDVYPVTLIKFLLNRRRITNFFSKVANPKFDISDAYTLDSSNCEKCQTAQKLKLLCRQHTSINRILTADKVAFDVDTNIYFHKNEIYREVDGKIVIIYCPHTKLMKGKTTDAKVRRIDSFVVSDPKVKTIPEYSQISKFVSSDLMEKNVMAWYNHEFSIITIPEDRNVCKWHLMPNF